LTALGSDSTPADAAQAFENACTTLVTGTTFTAVEPATISPPPTPLTASPGTLKAVLQPIFEAPAAGTSAATQAASIGNAIYTFLAGWVVPVTIPPSAPSPVAIL
jgi:hypothetical protein